MMHADCEREIFAMATRSSLAAIVALSLLASAAHGFMLPSAWPSSHSLRARTTSMDVTKFEDLEAQEKVALVRAVNNATYSALLLADAAGADEESSASAWTTIKTDFPDLAELGDDTLDACYAELKAIAKGAEVALPKPDDSQGLAAGAAPIAIVTLFTIASLFGLTGGSVVCGEGSTSRACAEQAARQAAK